MSIKRDQRRCCHETPYEIRITGPKLNIEELLRQAFGGGKKPGKKKHRKK